MAKKDKNSNIHNIVKGRKLPILTLDSRWHELFTDDQKTSEIRDLEQKVNNLLKKQGKLVNDIKDMKKLKNNLLAEIMNNMDISKDNGVKDKKLIKNKQFVNELNDKLERAMDELGDIPYQIKEVNEALMSESIKLFYNRMDQNKEELQELAEWINKIREEITQKILMKQDMEEKNTKIYTYMHDILGGELMELFDREHNKKR